jgi:phospholipase D-like protein/putative oligomerization/nucleic acid binding protein
VLAADYPFLDVLWTMIIFFAWVIWIWILISILADLFRRHDVSGWMKAAWVVFLILLPFLGVLIYLIANGQGMAERNVKQAQQQVQAAAAIAGPSAQIAHAKDLLDQGAISQEEFEALKRKALAD